jgi:hypothetical protein
MRAADDGVVDAAVGDEATVAAGGVVDAVVGDGAIVAAGDGTTVAASGVACVGAQPAANNMTPVRISPKRIH